MNLLKGTFVSVLFVVLSSSSWAADEAIVTLQTDVETTKGKAEANTAAIENLKGGLPNERAERIAADDQLWDFVLQSNDSTPPSITYDIPETVYSLGEELFTFSLEDNSAVGYLAIQPLSGDYESKTYYAIPNEGAVNILAPLSLALGSNEFVIVAADTYGNLSQSLLTTYREPVISQASGTLKFDYYYYSGKRISYREVVKIDLVPGSKSVVKVQYETPVSSYSGWGFPQKIAVMDSNYNDLHETCLTANDYVNLGNGRFQFTIEFPVIDTAINGSTYYVKIYSKRSTSRGGFGTADYTIEALNVDTDNTSMISSSTVVNDASYDTVNDRGGACLM